jgi:uncharacterized membrane protein YraQ (UPF0718 family)
VSEIFAEQFTAVANAVLAVFAIITAVLAGLAFRKQAREVRDQAEMLRIQAQQLDEQRKINELQAEDLRESLRERRRSRQSAERAQATLIDFRMAATTLPYPIEGGYGGLLVSGGNSVHIAVVVIGTMVPRLAGEGSCP